MTAILFSELEWVDALHEGTGYDWNTLGVLKSPDGRLWWGHSSGCSCNCFEDSFKSTQDMDELNGRTLQMFWDNVAKFPTDPAEKNALRAKIIGMLR